MKQGQIIIFTSGSGQYYHIYAIARCIRDFSKNLQHNFENFEGDASALNKFINLLYEKGYIENLVVTEFNRKETGNDDYKVGKAKVRRLVDRPLLEAYRPFVDNENDCREDVE